MSLAASLAVSHLRCVADPLHSEGKIQMTESITAVPGEPVCLGTSPFPSSTGTQSYKSPQLRILVGQGWDQKHQDSYVAKTHYGPTDVHI